MARYINKKTSVEHHIKKPKRPLYFWEYNKVVQSLSLELTNKKHKDRNIHKNYAGYLKTSKVMGPVGTIQYQFGIVTGKPEIYYHSTPEAKSKFHMTFD